MKHGQRLVAVLAVIASSSPAFAGQTHVAGDTNTELALSSYPRNWCVELNNPAKDDSGESNGGILHSFIDHNSLSNVGPGNTLVVYTSGKSFEVTWEGPKSKSVTVSWSLCHD
jgi:hypothetical protein